VEQVRLRADEQARRIVAVVERATDRPVLALVGRLVALTLHQPEQGDFRFQAGNLGVGDAGHKQVPPKKCQ